MRSAKIERKTAETDISLSFCLDGTGESKVNTGCGFLDHMLTLFAKHGMFTLDVSCVGDTQVDYHHTVEDVGICLGQAFAEAIGDKRGITRYGSMILPMDEALILCALDISGRAHLSYDLSIPTEKIGTMDSELVEEFFQGFVRESRITLHLKKLAGTNAHHIAEGAFKAFARALRAAVSIDAQASGAIPSTKGVL